MSVTTPGGFEAAGIPSGIKASGAPDLALVAAADRRPVPAAGVFTTNRVQAAPVQVSAAHLADGHAAAVILNSGNANAATGESGMDAAERMASVAAGEIGCDRSDVLVCSTGLIGIPFPIEVVEAATPKLAASLAGGDAAARAAAEAIMTTDTKPKEALAHVEVGGNAVAVGGLAKGAAMLAPSMATMLAVATTDATAEPDVLKEALDHAVDASFHTLIVDGCTSTNDTVLLLASGASGAAPIERATPAFHDFTAALTDVLRSLAEQMAADAEGATKLVRVHVRGAQSDADARRAARAVANSLLVKCSFYGKDPYWGRVLSELGASGAHMEPDKTSVAYGGIVVCRRGVAAEHDADAVAAVMEERDIELVCDLGLGTGSATVLTCDLTHEYVDENMGTS
ncbi:MAG TPA: bifunctional glutamate N-acetyltransferase/amino-acid acetyltransferase ArgJ [Acidimicrobiia bacterium]|nr:bifunctional glutamate N-acetyltransferase/amino-acid acetyltransferase ArgJ [Acidimicrobiia bacterium]